MKQCNRRSFWGIALVVGGVYLLFQNLGMASGWGNLVLNIFWGLAFGIGSLVMLTAFATAPQERWWAAIPGFVLGGLASVTVIEELIPVAEPITGALFLGSIGAAFVTVFLFNQHQWWAIIPGGIMTSLAIVAGIDEIPQLAALIGIDTGALFLMGMSLTFLAVAMLPVSGQKMTWAFIPSAILMTIALISGTNIEQTFNSVWPLLLILGGGGLLYRHYLEDKQMV